MEEKIGFFEGFVKSFYSFKDYPRYRQQHGFKIFLYILLLTLICSIPAVLVCFGIKGAVANTEEKIGSFPKWEFQGNELHFEDDFILTGSEEFTSPEEYPEMTDQFFWAIDTDLEYYIDFEEGYVYAYDPLTLETKCAVAASDNIEGIICIGKTSAITYNAANGQYSEIIYSELSVQEKEMLSYDSVMKFINLLWIIVFAIVVVCTFISVLFGALLQTFLALIQNKGASNSFGELFKMAVHARTIPSVIVALSGILKVSIPFGSYIIGAVFMYFAIKETKEADALALNSMMRFNSTDRNSDSMNSSSYSNMGNSSSNDDYSTPFNNMSNTTSNDDYNTPFNNMNNNNNSSL